MCKMVCDSCCVVVTFGADEPMAHSFLSAVMSLGTAHDLPPIVEIFHMMCVILGAMGSSCSPCRVMISIHCSGGAAVFMIALCPSKRMMPSVMLYGSSPSASMSLK